MAKCAQRGTIHRPSLAPRSGSLHGAWTGPPPGWRSRFGVWGSWLHEHRYLALLAILVCGVIVQSVDRGVVLVTVLSEFLLGVSLLVMAVVVFTGRRGRFAALWAGVAVVAIGWGRAFLPEVTHVSLRVVQQLLLMLFHGWAAALILRDVFRQQRIRTDDVLGAVSGYLLAAGAWANLYILFASLLPGSFTISPELASQFTEQQGQLSLYIYFSLATITSVGYGDVVPARGPMTACAMLETVFGQFYLAVVVAQLVGMRLAQGPRGPDD
jgi:hypothetical protein